MVRSAAWEQPIGVCAKKREWLVAGRPACGPNVQIEGELGCAKKRESLVAGRPACGPNVQIEGELGWPSQRTHERRDGQGVQGEAADGYFAAAQSDAASLR